MVASAKSDESEKDGRWHIDRNVPLALVYLLMAQFLGAVWFASNIVGKVESQDRRITTIESQKVSERLVTLESQMADTKNLLQRVDGNLLRLVERSSQK